MKFHFWEMFANANAVIEYPECTWFKKMPIPQRWMKTPLILHQYYGGQKNIIK